MRFERDPDLLSWFAALALSKRLFQWDRGNTSKHRKHNVTPAEIEELFFNPFVLGGRIVEPYHPESRWVLFGQTLKGRNLTLIFTVRDELIRPISCRAMRKEEKKLYEENID